MRLNPYLRFDGQCADAFGFYQRVLGGRMEMMMRYGESPTAAETPPDARDRIMHCSLAVAGVSLMGADGPPGRCAPAADGATVVLGVDTTEEAERVFAALSDGGAVRMPLQQTFWALRFGVVVDRFGTSWMINCEQPPS